MSLWFQVGIVLKAYALVAVAIVYGVTVIARRRGRSPARWGSAAAAIMGLVLLWDWPPVVLSHHYRCAKEAGLKIFVTPGQWREAGKAGAGARPVDTAENRDARRFVLVHRNHITTRDEGELFLKVWRWTDELVDTKTGELLARRVNFSAGNGYRHSDPPVKFWLQVRDCKGAPEEALQLAALLRQFREAEGQR
ncbi:MAG: hypothetical protein Q8L65_13360 [Burkholderiales bacterium]|nr:hypothetical protein [Burkholderiales bacterium]MDP2399097.1 hypothetical protein [Burkholderiales bacterium]